MTSQSQKAAANILSVASRLGWQVEVRGSILTISKKFTPGNMEQYVDADGEYYFILEHLKSTSPGSIWGTTSDGIGGLSAINSGCYVANKSGGSVRVLNALKKMI